jgi:hypothetical protein
VVLVKTVLRPVTMPARANWKEACQRCLEILKRCVYLDKDLVLPPMTVAMAEETFLVVASTDLKGANIMMTRIREQLGKVAELSGTGKLELTAEAVALPDPGSGRSLEEQVQEVAATVNEMVQKVLGGN